MNREEFLNRINKEGFSFAIDMTRCGFSDCKSLVRSRRLSEEQLYQMFVEFCEELENCLKEAGDERRMLFNKYPVSPVMINIKTSSMRFLQTDVNSASILCLEMTII